MGLYKDTIIFWFKEKLNLVQNNTARNKKGTNWVKEKLNPAQSNIAQDEGTSVPSNQKTDYRKAYETLEVVNRGTNMIISACSSFDYDIKPNKVHEGNFPGLRLKQLINLLNFRPNPYQSVQDFRTAIFTDFLFDGNAFIYYDGTFIYHLPAAMVEIIPDEKTYIKQFIYDSTQVFPPMEIAYFRDINPHSIYRGKSRILGALGAIGLLHKMNEFQNNFFDNGAVFNLAITSDNTLSEPAKAKTLAHWSKQHNPKTGGKRPIILDSGLKPVPLNNSASFKEMDFDSSIKTNSVRVLETLGVPPVLLDGGNQANISPNLRLFYLETVLPIVRKYVSAIELMTGYDIEPITANISALQPDLKDISQYHSTLVNTGITKPNEARAELRYPPDSSPESDKLRIPANIAGSAADPSQGGAPKKPDQK